MKLRNLQWYVLNPEGERMTDVIVAGPFVAEWDAEKRCRIGQHLALLDADRVARALDEERRLARALAPHLPEIPAERPTRVSITASGTRTVG